jgi:hypothetical protein
MKIKTALVLAAMSGNIMAQSIGVGSSVEEFRKKVQTSLDGVRHSMEIQIGTRPLNFSDYDDASKQLLKRIDASSKNFQNSLSGVENFLSWYDSVNNAASSAPENRALSRLMEKKEVELKALRESYKSYAQSFVMLDGHLGFEARAKMIGFTNSAGPQAVLGLFPAITPVIVIGMITGLTNTHKFATVDIYNNRKSIVDAEWMEFEGRPGPRAKAEVESSLGYNASTLFGACKTQGCVYYLAEDILYWIKESDEMSSVLNIPIHGVDDMKNSDLIKFKHIQKAIDKMADIAAAGKPTGN